ncbi:MAG: sulfotransferase [Candidatus Thermoplasmatota archaeon]
MGIDDPHLEKIKHQNIQLVFILGFHRSGTSILYKMLTATGCFNPVTAYHIINYETLIDTHLHNKTKEAQRHLTDTFKQHGLDDRAIDTLQVTADFAEEYGFLLDRYSNTMKLSPSNIDVFTTLCQKIQFLAENNKPILVKNPYDFSNFLFLKKRFPQAKFIFIHRHPFKTISSTINAMHVLLQQKNYYTTQLSKTYTKIYENPLLLLPLRMLFSHLSVFSCMLLTMYTAHGTRYYLRNINKLTADDYISITYDELCAHPEKIISEILKKLHLTTEHKISYDTFIRSRKTDLHPSVVVLQSFIYRSMKRYCSTFSYTKDAVE